MSSISRIAALCVLTASASCAGQAHANLLTNGSFEDTTNFVSSGNGTEELYPNNSSATAMPGWTVINNDLSWIGPTNPFGVTAPTGGGNYFLDLSGYHNGDPSGGLTQTVSTTPGATYLLTFELGSSPQYGIQDGVAVNAGSTSGTFATTNDGTQNNLWQSESLAFTATATTTPISFVGNLGQNYVGLDTVDLIQTSTVSGVPETSTWVMMLLGFSALGLLARFRRNEPRLTLTPG